MLYFGMFTDKGNKACTQAYQIIYNVIFGDKFTSEARLKEIVKDQIAQVEVNNKEVHDIEPELYFINRINIALETRGYGYRVTRDDL